jgi:alcohol dehydrogenase class IV
MWKAPHGAVCAALLPAVMRANIAALARRDPQSPVLVRYRELNGLLAAGGDAVDWTAGLVAALGIPKLSAVGVQANDVPLLVEKAKVASSMRGNPIVLTDEELTTIVNESLA